MSRINTNVPALQAMHRLQTNQFDLGLRLERLSTGLRINRGRDDPAGLIASETLRSEIRGLSQAVENSQRAVNVMSTAEGSLNEISSLLIDLRGLINHAANEGAIGSDELKADQLQIDSILESIDRIANTTQFGGEKLINGNMEYTTSAVSTTNIADATIFGARVPEGSYLGVVVEVTNSAETAQVTYSGATLANGNVTIQVQGNEGTEIFSFASGLTIAKVALAVNGFSQLTGVSAAVSGTTLLMNSTQYGSDKVISVKALEGTWFTVATGQTDSDTGLDASVLINGQTASASGLTASLRSAGLDLELDLTASFGGGSNGATTFYITGGGATFQIGPEVNSSGQVSIGLPSMVASNLGNSALGFLNTINSSGSNSVIGGNYAAAEDIVIKAVSQVATIRGRIGGLQKNQIETNINSQSVALENVTAAESSIRNADFAVEVAALTRAQILVQSTTSILGLANQLPQNVLALLGWRRRDDGLEGIFSGTDPIPKRM